MISKPASGNIWCKLVILIYGLFVAASMGILVEVTRFYVFSYIDVHWAVDAMPQLGRFLITLPSNNLHHRHNVYILMFGISWTALAIKLIDCDKTKIYSLTNTWMILNIVFGINLSLAMIYPCLPQLKILPPKELPGSLAADVIAVLFYILIATLFVKFTHCFLRSKSAK